MEKMKRIFYYRFDIITIMNNIQLYLPGVGNEEVIKDIAFEYMKMVIDCHLVGIDHTIQEKDGDNGIVVEVPRVIPLEELEKYMKNFKINLPFYDDPFGESNKIMVNVSQRISYNNLSEK